MKGDSSGCNFLLCKSTTNAAFVTYLHEEPAKLFERLQKGLISDLSDHQDVERRFAPGKPLAGRVLNVPAGKVDRVAKHDVCRHCTPNKEKRHALCPVSTLVTQLTVMVKYWKAL